MTNLKPLILPFRGIRPILPESCYLAPGVCIVGDVILGEDSSVWFHSIIRADVNYVRIGRRTNVQDQCVLHVSAGTHPLNIGDEVTIAHAAVIHGCSIEDGCFVGIGARILDGAQIGRESLVAAGAVVTPNMIIPPRSLVLGVPARVKRSLEEKEVEKIRASARTYVDYASEYRDGVHE
ncbi:MAG: gamma carbonic anhydrase family protein [Candidatus Eisenbacteria bacterium]|uniref:Gamma carbonic anhydrase family protein n=1 Tax=Eiseniibacteriota bacterium TaxID=2212470 RepID=A0A948W5I9_UNCEI|nr:gamma carbonic anhydrase family protein [Candidatus Eisenbacteria bacterium]MBU1950665.1 gamma carbonic anhydrase family protein [Candidatus Eisenbacteria bacterium]MBU2689636.1 gamma carbonic anhydrase family protein [Candidatus Eisenbacteria bacterium]